MQLNANVDGTGPELGTKGMEYKQNNERLCDVKYSLLSKWVHFLDADRNKDVLMWITQPC